MFASGSAGRSSPHFSLPGGASVLLERRSSYYSCTTIIVVGYVGVAIGTEDGGLTGVDITEVDWHAGVDDGAVRCEAGSGGTRGKGRTAAVTERSWSWVVHGLDVLDAVDGAVAVATVLLFVVA